MSFSLWIQGKKILKYGLSIAKHSPSRLCSLYGQPWGSAVPATGPGHCSGFPSPSPFPHFSQELSFSLYPASPAIQQLEEGRGSTASEGTATRVLPAWAPVARGAAALAGRTVAPIWLSERVLTSPVSWVMLCFFCLVWWWWWGVRAKESQILLFLRKVLWYSSWNYEAIFT